MKAYNWNQCTNELRQTLLQRPTRAVQKELADSVARIIEQVRADGDIALRALTRRFDGVELSALQVTEADFNRADASVSNDLKTAMREAKQRLELWHEAGKPGEFEIETAEGVRCGRILRGIGTVGLYVPAGTAPLPSTALMLGVPASIAQCEDVILCTPIRSNGDADPAVLVAAKLCGITKVFKLGGAQAVAAMAFGTESIPRCDKIFGPGNSYVTQAKQQVSMMPGGPAIDMPAGPSEVLVIADAGANPVFVASDLLSQAEHGPDSQVILLSDSAELINRVANELQTQLAKLPREAIAEQALENSRAIEVESIETAIAISNLYAPEHLILALRNPEAYLSQVKSAGSIFLGDYAPESLGDYCSGTNHVLPTNGAARAYSGVSVASFQKSISIQSVTQAGLKTIGPCAVTLANAEGLQAHANAVLLRMGEP
ncbi:MAG: histidinol dehydrogenase [Arenimonas sp.]